MFFLVVSSCLLVTTTCEVGLPADDDAPYQAPYDDDDEEEDDQEDNQDHRPLADQTGLAAFRARMAFVQNNGDN